MTVELHLWDIAHPYYCSESNYYSNEPGSRFESWAEFIEEAICATGDLDLNLLFRWDWNRCDPSDYEPDEEIPGDTLDLFFMFQRKGIFAPFTVAITEADEPAVREWLAVRWEHMRLLWAGVSEAR